MNVYRLHALVKSKLRKTKLTKTGKNDYNGQEYFQLQDFLPKIMELCEEHNLDTYVTFPEGSAQLIITNIENPEEQIIIEGPFGSASLKGCHEVQNIGAVETYQRRYMYMAGFDIIENDMIDSGIAITLDPDIKRIQKCESIDELTHVWKEVYNLYKADKEAIGILTKEKDLMKESLQLGGGT